MKVTAAEMGQNFDQYAAEALAQPATITRHTEDQLVLLSVESIID